MSFLGGTSNESERAAVNAEVARTVMDANRRDLDEIKRARYLERLGVHGQVAFGLYVDGFGLGEAGSLCSVAVIPSSVVFFDADATAEPDAELGRAPRDGFTAEASAERRTVLAQDFPDAPWTIRSFQGPGAVDLRGQVVATWNGGRATFAFATVEGAEEAVAGLRKLLARTPTV